MFTKEMQDALKADGEKLRQMTGEDHGPQFIMCPFDNPGFYLDTGSPCPVCGALGDDDSVFQKCIDIVPQS